MIKTNREVVKDDSIFEHLWQRASGQSMQSRQQQDLINDKTVHYPFMPKGGSLVYHDMMNTYHTSAYDIITWHQKILEV